MIKNIIFDMGNVMIYFDRGAFLDHFGITDPEDRDILLREVYLSLEWSMMDRGTLTDRAAAEIMEKRVPEHLKSYVRPLVEHWEEPLMPVPGMAELARELKGLGYGIYLLSNASLRQHEYWEMIPGHEVFDGTLISADELLVKPQNEIYRLLCGRFGLAPEECVFIDDSTQNCEGAIFNGMHAIVFHDDVREVREKLRDIGVACREANQE